MFYDQRGLPLTAANEQAVLSYDATINAYLGFQLTTGTQRGLGSGRQYAHATYPTRLFHETLCRTRARGQGATMP